MIYKISVIMPAYNAEKYIGEAIESILNQTYKDFEFIIINDGSTDGTEDIILSYDDPRIVYLKNEENSGIVASLNNGLKYAKGQYIARMDADDIALLERFEKQVDYLENNQNVGVLGTGILIFGDDITDRVRLFNQNSEELKIELLFCPCVAHPTVMFRKDILESNAIHYDFDCVGAEDYCLWIELFDKCDFMNLPEPLLKYRKHEKQVTHKRTTKDIKVLEFLLDKRINKIGVNLNSNEKKSFLTYCLGNFDSYTAESIKIFIQALSNILCNNLKNRYFDQNKLKKIFSLAVINTLNNSSIDQKKKKECYKYAIDKHIFSLIMRFKIMIMAYLNK